MKIGTTVIYNGCLFDIVIERGKSWGCMPVLECEEFKANIVYFINKKKVVPAETHDFEIGEYVMSKLSSTPFVGKIVGYEADEDRFICKSIKIDNYADKRTRYAYRRYELDPCPINDTTIIVEVN